MSENRHGAYTLIKGDRKIHRMYDITVMEETKQGRRAGDVGGTVLIKVVREGLSKKGTYV